MIAPAPATCASCNESGLSYYHCRTCGTSYCPACAASLRMTCPTCRGPVSRGDQSIPL